MTVFWHLKVSSNARKIGRGEIIFIAQNYLCYIFFLVEENINLDMLKYEKHMPGQKFNINWAKALKKICLSGEQ